MLKKISLVFLIFSIFMYPVCAQDALLSGHDWKQFMPIMKISYISGLYDGAGFCEAGILNSLYLGQSPMEKRMPFDISYKDLVNMLDEFYLDDTNLLIPIPYAIYILKQIQDGVGLEKIEIYKNQLRSSHDIE